MKRVVLAGFDLGMYSAVRSSPNAATWRAKLPRYCAELVKRGRQLRASSGGGKDVGASLVFEPVALARIGIVVA